MICIRFSTNTLARAGHQYNQVDKMCQKWDIYLKIFIAFRNLNSENCKMRLFLISHVFTAHHEHPVDSPLEPRHQPRVQQPRQHHRCPPRESVEAKLARYFHGDPVDIYRNSIEE